MSQAMRCDRCKKCFDPYSEEEQFLSVSDIKVRNGAEYEEHILSVREGCLDLCPECTKEFLKWLGFKEFRKPDQKAKPRDPFSFDSVFGSSLDSLWSK